MATKTISITDEAYARLRARRKGRHDSFSRVIMRAHWEDHALTAGELLDSLLDAPRFYSDEELDEIERAKRMSPVPEDKWNPA